MATPAFFDDDIPEYEPIRRLSRDFRQAAALMSPAEIRYLIDRYYQIQEDRKRGNNQLRAASVDREPNTFLAWLSQQVEQFEGVCKSALTITSRQTIPGRWCNSILGIGPVLTAGLLANLDITKSKYPSQVWRFFGLDPSRPWLGQEKAAQVYREIETVSPTGKKPSDLVDALALRTNTKPDLLLNMVAVQSRGKDRTAPLRPLEEVRASVTRKQLIDALATRPWNAQGKLICFKIGSSLNKIQNNPNDTGYAKIYVERKALEWQRNLRGDYVRQCDEAKSRNLTAEQRPWYYGSYSANACRTQYEQGLNPSKWDLVPRETGGTPMLPPGRIEFRARRIAVKLFLSHLHHVMHECHYGKPPDVPYIFAGDSRHVHYVPPFAWPGVENFDK